MSVWVGTLGSMVETPCLSGLAVEQGDRTVFGGGPGTLSPPRAVQWGQPRRTWSCEIDAEEPGGLAALETLAWRQSVYGGTYRLLACDAQNTNLFTPGASLAFAGWSGTFTLSSLYTASAETVGGGTVLYEGTPLDARTPLEGGPPVRTVDSVAALTITALAGDTLVSPVVPVRPGYPVTLGIFGQGSAVKVSARWVNAAGGTLSTVDLVTVNHAELQRVNPSTIAPADAAGVQLVVTGGTRYAWPSVTWTAGPRRYATGRGAINVVLSPLSESLILATARTQLSSFRYTIREVA